MDAHELRARTAWGLIADPADTLAWRLQREFGPIEALRQLLGSHNIRALSKRLSATLTDGEVSLESLRTYRSRYSPDRVARALDVQLEQGITAISPEHPWWPPRLSDLGERAPTTLWVKGSVHQASGTQGVAIVGSSRPTRSGRQAAIACSEGALEKGLTILSGGTRGISTDAHRRAVNGGGISVAVVTGGLESTYPPDNGSLFDRVLQRGAMVSEVPATVAPTIGGLLARNRLVAALADGVVAVQAEYRSGAISVSYHGAALGRHVGVVPGPWNDTRSAGCWRIYRECGAIVLTEPADISLVIPGVTHPPTNQKSENTMTAFSQHPGAEHLIVHLSDTHFLGSGRKLYDQIDSDSPLERLMERLHASEMSVDALVFTGDLADRAEVDAYRRLRDLIEPWAAKLEAELVWVMGNHDEREPFTEVLLREEPTVEPRDRVVMLGGLRLIVLDSSVPGYHHGEITEGQRSWLREQLAQPAPHGTLLALHHPPIPTPIDLMGLIELDDQAALAEVVSGSDVRGVLAGHLHYSTFSTFAGVPVSVSAASCYNIDLVADSSKILCAKANPLSASLVHVYPDQVVFSQVPMDDEPELTSYESSYRPMIEAMTPDERREMFSNKNSDFNRQSDQQQSGF